MRQRKPLSAPPRRNASLRKIVRERSEGMCAKCGKYDAKGESDHQVPLWAGGKDDLSNLQWLCRRCHLSKSVGETPVRAKTDRLRARADLTQKRREIR